MSLLRWTCKSAAQLAAALRAQGHPVSERTVNRLLHDLGYSLQSNRKTLEGSTHPDRDAQFQYINRHAKAFQKQGQPVVSVDTKKKELVGQFRNGGREWYPQGQPEEVEVHDFPSKTLGKVIPYGVYDEATNTGWVSVGVDHDTASLPWRRCGAGGDIWADGSIPRQTAPRHSLWWWLQRQSVPPMEGGVATSGGSDGSAHLGVPLSTGDE